MGFWIILINWKAEALPGQAGIEDCKLNIYRYGSLSADAFSETVLGKCGPGRAAMEQLIEFRFQVSGVRKPRC